MNFAISCAVMMALTVPLAADSTADTQAIKNLIAKYAESVNQADTTKSVDQLFSNAPEVTFIHPLGEEHGRAQIQADVYRKIMAGTFSDRKLSPKDLSIHVYGDTAWSEFNWDFVAKLRKDGSPFHSQGRETHVYHRENGQWRIVHVHYSGTPVTGN